MKILEIQFENINSLYGKWRIDFTRPDFIQDGIFAITGPTGAGKSSILDVICLALYGCTPRLKRVNQNSNDMMSKKTGHCMAEVLFETNKGRFRCQWAQRRARGSSEGNLQTPKHEISDAEGVVLSTKLKEVPLKVESLTGMNFDRFTRSMLLAQGKFASFLQASADERAPILEQITGTEIYSQISKEVHIVHAEEKNKLNGLEAELKGVELLSPEDEAALLAEYAEQEKQCQAFNAQEKICQRDITWLHHLTDLKHHLDVNQSKQTAIEQQWQAMQPDRNKLQYAEQALELDADYQALKKLRTDKQQSIEAYEKLKNKEPEVQENQAENSSQEKKLFQKLNDEKDLLKTLTPIFKQVREQDIHIGNQQKMLDEAQANDVQLQADVRSLQGKVSGLKLQEEGLKVSISQLEDALKEHAHDARLHEQFSGLQLECRALQEKQFHVQNLQKDVQKNDLLLIQHEKDGQQIETSLHDQSQELGKLQDKINDKQHALQELLQKKTLSAWRKKKDELVDMHTSLKEVIHAATQAQQAKQQKEKHQTAIQTLKAKQADVSQQCETIKKIMTNSQLELDDWQQQCDAFKTIQSYEQARLKLQDDCACPLCGSKHHPFAEGNIPALDATEKQLKQRQTQHKAHQKEETKLIIQSKGIQHDNSYHQKELKACEIKGNEHRTMLESYCQSHDIDVLNDDFLAPLQDRLQVQEKDRQDIEKQVALGEALELAQQSLQTKLGEQGYVLTQLKLKQVTVHANQEHTVGEKKRLAHELEDMTSNRKVSKKKLAQQLLFYGVQDWNIETLPAIQADLQQRSQTWQKQQKALTEANQKSIRLIAGCTVKEGKLKDTQDQAKLKQDDVTKKKNHLNDLKQERSKLFAARHPDDEEAALTDKILKLEEEHEEARQASIESKQAWETIQRDVTELCENIEASRKRIEDTQIVFQEALKHHGFDDEAMFCQSLLSQSERQRLKAIITSLEKQKNTVQGNITRLIQDIAAQQTLQYTTQSLDELQTHLDALKEALSDANKTMGAMAEQRKEQEANKKKLQAHIEKIDAQKRELARWTNLNDLIGSADGKKFRNFAQGLTFELVVQYANQQLRNMSDRYVLQRDNEQPLELNVVDGYQAGEVRSIKNISGGESFIISLALSLGLSQMSSKNVKIDSLFLDEGFGSLDHESLETAIDTLANLQQGGKLIGIISHVDSIKERIGTQIQVQPISEGKSAISGSGCYAL